MTRTTLPAPANGDRSSAMAETAGQSHAVAIRQAAKADRDALTEALRSFAAASSAPGSIYARYTRMIYRHFGLHDRVKEAKCRKIDTRDLLTAAELTYIQSAERAIAVIIREGEALARPRADVKADLATVIADIAAAHRRPIQAERAALAAHQAAAGCR